MKQNIAWQTVKIMFLIGTFLSLIIGASRL